MLIDILLVLVFSEDNECFIVEALGKVNNTQLNIALISAHTHKYSHTLLITFRGRRQGPGFKELQSDGVVLLSIMPHQQT